QDPVDVDAAGAQGGEPVVVQVLQVDKGDSVVILFHDLERVPAPGRQVGQVRADLDVAYGKELVDLLRLFRHGPQVGVVAGLDAVGGKDFFRLLQPLGQKPVVPLLDTLPADGAAAEGHVGNPH